MSATQTVLKVTTETLSIEERRQFISGRWPAAWEMTDQHQNVGLKALPAARVAVTMQMQAQFAREVAVRFAHQACQGPWQGDQKNWRLYYCCRECGGQGLKILEVEHLAACKVAALLAWGGEA